MQPTRIPAGLRLTGSPYVTVYTKISPPGGDRTEDTPAKPKLTAVFNPVEIVRSGNTNAIAKGFFVSYQGPATTLLDISKSGTNPDKFSVFGPATPVNLEKSTAFIVNVIFLGTAANDYNYYSCTITIQTANAVESVIVNSNPF